MVVVFFCFTPFPEGKPEDAASKFYEERRLVGGQVKTTTI